MSIIAVPEPGNQAQVKVALTSVKDGRRISACVNRLLSAVPRSAIANLRAVVLRDAGGLSSREFKKRRRGGSGKVLLGTYYPATGSSGPSIDLFVDAILRAEPRSLLRIPVYLDARVGRVLYHELGHHVAAVQRPWERSSETTAELWQRDMLRTYMKRRYWYLRPIALALLPFVKLVRRSLSTGKRVLN